MTSGFTCTVPGIPRPQGSKRLVRLKSGRSVMIESSPDVRSWRSAITSAVSLLRNGAFYEGPVYVYLHFSMPRPKKPKHNHPAVRPDCDKLARAALDAISDAGLWHDDGQVCQLHVLKRYADPEVGPGLQITVEAMA